MADDNEKKSTEEENKEVADAAPPKEEENLVVEGYEFLSKEDVKKAESAKHRYSWTENPLHKDCGLRGCL